MSYMTKPPDKFVKHFCRECGAWIEHDLCSYECKQDATYPSDRPAGSVGVATYKLENVKDAT